MVLIFCRNLLQQIGLEPPFRQGCRPVNLCRAPPVSAIFIDGIKEKIVCVAQRYRRWGAVNKKGRPDGWLYVGGTKAGPAVLWLYPFGGAPNGHKAKAKLAPVGGASEAPQGVKFVMDCRRDARLPRRH